MLQEALTAALEDIADVHAFPAYRGDTIGLLRSLKPDAVVVDDEQEAQAAAPFGRETNSPILHIAIRDRDRKLRILRNGGWEEAGHAAASPEEIRNILIASLLARGEGLTA